MLCLSHADGRKRPANFTVMSGHGEEAATGVDVEVNDREEVDRIVEKVKLF